jgi:hypothetical protein
MPSREVIYDALYRASQPATLPGPWRRLACHASFRQLSAQGLAEVTQLFSEPDLIAAGVMRSREGITEISPLLREPPVLLLFTYRQQESTPYQVIAGLRGLGPHVGGLSAVLQDRQVREWLAEDNGAMMLASSMNDIAILWSGEIPAAPAIGLHDIGGPRFEVLLRQLCDDGSDWPRGFELAGCDLASLRATVDPYLSRVQRHLDELNKNLDANINCQWWQPTQARFEQLDFVLKYGTDAQVIKLLGDSTSDLGLARDARQLPDSRAPGLREAFEQQRAAYGRSEVYDRSSSWQRFHDSIRVNIAEPLLTQAQQTADPQERACLAARAAFTSVALGELHLLANKLALPSQDPKHCQASLTDGDLQRALELFNALNDAKQAKKHARKR